MALEIVLLEGGPDNGVELGYNVPPALPATILYSESVYDNAHATKHDSAGDLVHEYKFNATASAGVRAPHAHQGWAALQHSLNRNWNPALNQSEHNIHVALRSLGRGRKVRT